MKVIYDLVFLSKERFGGISRCWQAFFERLPGTPVEPHFIAGPADNLVQDYLEQTSWCGGTVDWEMPVQGLRQKLRMLGFWRNLQLMQMSVPKGGAIFHSTDYINPLLPRPGLKIVTTIHDMVFWDQADRFDKNIWYWDKRWATWHSLRVSDAVITVSEASRQSILKRFPWAERKIFVVPHGLDTSLAALPVTLRKQPQFLFVGGRNSYKNFDLLLDAFARFHALQPDWKLHVVGENEHSRAAEAERYRALGIAENVVDHGLVDQDTLIGLIAACGAVVIPSLNEGFNFPLLEAMAAGAPVLSSDIPASRELGAGHARYFSPRSIDSLVSAMADLVASPPTESELVAAQRHARSYDWSRSVGKIIDTYKRCLTGALS